MTSIFENMSDGESKRCLVIVFVGDADDTDARRTVESLRENFAPKLDEGLLEVVAPSQNFYPNLTDVRSLSGKSN